MLAGRSPHFISFLRRRPFFFVLPVWTNPHSPSHFCLASRPKIYPVSGWSLRVFRIRSKDTQNPRKRNGTVLLCECECVSFPFRLGVEQPKFQLEVGDFLETASEASEWKKKNAVLAKSWSWKSSPDDGARVYSIKSFHIWRGKEGGKNGPEPSSKLFPCESI